MRGKGLRGQNSVQLMVWFMVVVTAVVAVGLGYWMVQSKKPAEVAVVEGTKADKTSVKASQEAGFSHNPTEPFEVLGFEVPTDYRLIRPANMQADGSGSAFLFNEGQNVSFLVKRKMNGVLSNDITAALKVYAAPSVSKEDEETLVNFYNNQPNVTYHGLGDVLLSDGTPYGYLAYLEEEKGQLVAKVYTEFVMPDKSMLSIMAYRPGVAEENAEADVQALADALQEFLVQTGADSEAVLELPDDQASGG